MADLLVVDLLGVDLLGVDLLVADLLVADLLVVDLLVVGLVGGGLVGGGLVGGGLVGGGLVGGGLVGGGLVGGGPFCFHSLCIVILVHSPHFLNRLRHNSHTGFGRLIHPVLPVLLCPVDVPTGVWWLCEDARMLPPRTSSLPDQPSRCRHICHHPLWIPQYAALEFMQRNKPI